MATTPKVLLKRSSVAGRIPDSSDLQYGELAINFADGKLYYKDDANNINAFIDSARVQAIANAVEVVAQAQLDSGEVSSLVDSAYVQARVPLSYLEGLIDSAYVQARQVAQDFAYSSLTGAPNVLDSADVTSIVDSAYIQARQVDIFRDSGFISAIIDSAYIQARQLDSAANATLSLISQNSTKLNNQTASYYLDYTNLSNKPTILDTVDVSNIITTDVDKAFVDALNVDADTLDGYQAQYFIDKIDSNTARMLDSAEAIALIDSAYVQARQSTYTDFDTDFAAKTTTDLTEGNNLYYTKGRVDSDIAASLNDSGNTVTITINNVIEDKVDSAYVLARVNEAPFIDSADAINLIDSAYVQARQITYNTSNFTDSAFVTGLPVSTFTNDANYIATGDSATLSHLIVQGAVEIDGNLTVSGTTTTVSAQNLAVSDNMIYMNQGVAATIDSAGGDGTTQTYTADNNYIAGMSVTITGITPSSLNVYGGTVDSAYPTYFTVLGSVTDLYVSGGTARTKTNSNPDLGWAGGYNDGSYAHAGFFRDASDNKFKPFIGYTPEPDSDVFIDTTHPSFTLGGIQAGTLEGKYLGFDSDFGTKTTDDITEGSNLYYTTARHDSDTLAQVDAAYVQARQTVYTTANFTDSAFVTGLPVSTFTNDANYLDSTTVQGVIDATYIQANQTTYSNVSEFTNDANYLDSTTVQGVIDATYIQANQTTYSNVSEFTNDANYLDSTTATQLIDSAYVNARVAAGTDSATVSAIIEADVDSAYIQLRQNIADHNDIDFSGTTIDSDTTGTLSNTLTGDGLGAVAPGTSFSYSSGLANHFPLTGENSTTLGATITEILAGLSHRVDSDTFTFNQADSEAFYIKNDAGGYVYIYPTDTSGNYDDGKKLRLVFSGSQLYMRTTGVPSETSDRFARGISGSWPPSFGVDFEAVTEAGFLNINTLAITETVTLTDAPTTNGFLQYNGTSWVSTEIDSAYIQARQADIFRDSGFVTGIVDASYIQSNQTTYNTSNFTDSAFVTGLPVSTFTNDANYLDSTTATQLIDSAYIQLRQADIYRDSGFVTGIIDSAYIETRRPAEAIFSVVNDGASAYKFTGDGFDSANNPTLYLQRGLTYKFNVNASGHPFEIRLSNGGAAYNTGVTNNANQDSAVYFTPHMDAPNTLVYQCTVHSGMVGDIVIVDNNSFIDSAEVIKLITANAIDSGVALQLLLDSSEVVNLIDSAYINLRVDATVIDSIGAIGNVNAVGATEGQILKFDSATQKFILATDATAAGGGGGLDSAAIIDLIDSAYVQARQTAGGGGGTGTVDSDYVLEVASGGVTGLYQQTFYRFQADSGQTVFTGTDEYGQTLDYGAGAIDVFLNGILLLDSADYTQTSSSTLTLTEPADSADEVHIIWRRGTLVTPNVTTYEYTATGGQTTFTGTDANGKTLAYAAGAVQVFVNGILLKASEDYTATDGTSVVLTTSATALDDVAIAAYAAPHAKATSFNFTADSAQATFNGTDNFGNSLNYEPENSLVFLNGIALSDSDFTATNGTSVVLATAANLNDELKVVSFGAVTTTQTNNNWTETSTNIKISPNEKKFVDVSSNAVLLEIQDSGSNVSMGDELRIIDGYGNAATNNITLRSTKKIIGSDSDLIIDINRSGTNLVYYNESNGWVLIEN